MAAEPIIQMEAITKTYQMGKVEVHALRGVSLAIEAGAWVAIMGPSGSGKSTLMQIMGCLESPSSGNYRLNGVELSSMDEDALAEVRNRQIGFVFQNFNLLPRTSALHQVILPMQYRRNGHRIPRAERLARAQALLEQVGLSHRLDHLPTEMSGGQQQRVAIARALINDPPILMLDEPTGNLDTRSGDEIIAILEQLHTERGMTIIMVTHEAYIARRAGRIIRILDGRIAGDAAVGDTTRDTAEELRA